MACALWLSLPLELRLVTFFSNSFSQRSFRFQVNSSSLVKGFIRFAFLRLLFMVLGLPLVLVVSPLNQN
jgi:hypothetical protein